LESAIVLESVSLSAWVLAIELASAWGLASA
jgi:hypothetical protein